ncbi:MAG: NAD-dependent epimerase/dehydratase family protein, partial [Firmicutes bacterium]|nr:NAD-dependent epimerase/dehydratase family protein [Bacillota bacterium]
VIFRPTYVYGEENNLYREAFLFDRLLAELPIAIPDGTHTETQFLHIEDLVKIFERAAHTATAIGQAYNITHPERINWNLLLETAASIVNKRAKIVPATPAMLKMLNITARDFFPFRDVTYLLSIDKLEKSELPIPQVNLKQGLLRAYHWYAIVKPRLSDPKIDKLSLLLANLS